MKVTFELRFPIVHPVTSIHTWHIAKVAVPGLDLPVATIYEVIGDVIGLDQMGGVGTMLGLAERLRCLADKTMNLDYAGDGVEASCDAPPAMIEWGNSCHPLEGTDVIVAISFDDHRVYAGQDEFSFDFILRPDDRFGPDYGAEFANSLGYAHAEATQAGGCSCSD